MGPSAAARRGGRPRRVDIGPDAAVRRVRGDVLVDGGGHVLVVALEITSAGVEAGGLEYVKFWGKFYEGGAGSYTPSGYDRQYTTED